MKEKEVDPEYQPVWQEVEREPEPESEPADPQAQAKAHKKAEFRRKLKVVALTTVLMYCLINIVIPGIAHTLTKLVDATQKRPFRPIRSDICVNPPVLVPEEYKNDGNSLDFLKSYEFRNASLKRFQGAIQIPTESNELMGQPGEDEKWEIFLKFHDYLEKSYPNVHKTLSKEIVNRYGLLFTWKGTDESLKPVVLMAHQDVVPVLPETVSEWQYPPYSGHYDGTNVWGRGSGDDKCPLIGIMEAVENLVQNGKQPRRTVLISFGYDEESSGEHGAQKLAERIEEVWGQDSIYAIIDEGSAGLVRVKGTNVAVISVAEKGNYGADITLHTKGGHSSVPPPHTGIGIVADLIALVEATPHTAKLTDKNPLLDSLHCIGTHSETLDASTKRMLQSVGKCPRATRRITKVLSDYSPSLEYLMKTSQAVDLINGGIKMNALPESVTVRIDNRVSVDSSVHEVEQKLLDNTRQIAKKHNLGLRFNGDVLIEGDQYFEFKRFVSSPLEPAPKSSLSGPAWDEIGGTLRHVFQDFGGDLMDVETGEMHEPKNIVVVPSIMTGNTDTRWYNAHLTYSRLTGDVYRLNPLRVLSDPGHGDVGRGVHTVNENINFDTYIETIAFYRQYILNL